MAITYYEKEKLFKLDTPSSSYIIGIVDEEKFVGHVYYGKRLKDANVAYLMRTQENPFVPSKNNRDRCSFYDCFSFEYPTSGAGDYRESALSIRTMNGNVTSMLSYVSHTITKGKPVLEGLPATFDNENEVCDTLIITCEDKHLGMK